MINQQVVWEELWPLVQELIKATAAEDADNVKKFLLPDQQAAEILDIFGLPAFEILLKLILGRERLGLARAIETGDGRSAHIEFAWPNPRTGRDTFTAADIVSIHLTMQGKRWFVAEINPASADNPMTEARANHILLNAGLNDDEEDSHLEPWILPVALYGGALQLPLQKDAMRDEVERLFLPGFQQRGFGLVSTIGGRRLWRDFLLQDDPALTKSAVWAAAVETIISGQGLREETQAAISRFYGVTLAELLPSIRRINRILAIEGLVERYSPFGTGKVILNDSTSNRSI